MLRNPPERKARNRWWLPQTENRKKMTKIISEYFAQLDYSMGVVWHNYTLLHILLGLLHFIFFACLTLYPVVILESIKENGVASLFTSQFVSKWAKTFGVIDKIMLALFSCICVLIVAYLSFKIAQYSHNKFVYEQRVFIIFELFK